MTRTAPRSNRRSTTAGTAARRIAIIAIASLAGPTCGQPHEPETAGSAQAVSGAIVASAPIGTTPGSMNVSADGEGQFSLPLVVPPGRMGIEPQLSLEYSSGTGNGLLGMGWNLRGLSAIRSCPSSYGHDGKNRPVKLDGEDLFCLDGAPLVPVPGTSPQEYRTDPDAMMRILVASSDARGPVSWLVQTRDGRVLTYGSTSDSRVELNAYDRSTNDWTRPVRAAWALNQVADRSGNYMTITYATTYAPILAPTVEQKPLRIDYTGSSAGPPNRSVVFHYDLDQAPSRPDPVASWQGSVGFVTRSRLTSIVMSAPSTAGQSTQSVVRTYKLSYTTSASTSRSLLSSVQQCDGAGVCLPPTRFDHLLTMPSFAQPIVDTVGDAATPFDPSVTSVGLQFGDVNGDGFDDMVFYSRATRTWNVRLSNGPTNPGFGPVQRQLNVPGAPLPSSGAAPLARLYDINGDEKLDLYTLDCTSGSCVPHFYLSQSSGTTAVFGPAAAAFEPPSPPSTQVAMFDFDGDGTTDLFSTIGAAQYRSAATGQWSAVSFPESDPAYTALNHVPAVPELSIYRDIDGDGLPDYLRAWADTSRIDSTGHHPVLYDLISVRGGSHAVDINPSIHGYDPCDVWLDVNGDGLVDVVSLTTGMVEVNFGGGKGFVQSPAFGFSGDLAPRCKDAGFDAGIRVADYNGDGKQDILLTGKTTSGAETLRVLLAATDGTSPTFTLFTPGFPTLQAPDSTFDAGFTRTLDLDGDGMFDLFQLRSDGRFELYRGQGGGGLTDVMYAAGDGLGAATSFVYRALTQGAQYGHYLPNPACPGSDCAFPSRPFIGPRWVVAQEVLAGQSTPGLINHIYEDARVDMQGQGWLGFARHTVIDTRSGAVTRARFDLSRRGRTSTSISGETWPFKYLYRSKPSDLVSFVQTGGTLYESHTATTQREKCEPAGTSFAYDRATETRVYAGPADTAHPSDPYGILENPEISFTGRVTLTAATTVRSVDAFGNVTAERTVKGRGAHHFTAAAAVCGASELDDLDVRQGDELLTVNTTYQPVVTATWLIGLATTVTSESSAGGSTVDRRTAASYDTLGRLVETIREPTGTSGTDSRTGVMRSDVVYARTKILRTGTAGQLGLPTTVLLAPDASDGGPAVRSESTTYDADFVFPSAATSVLGQTRQTTFHPGLGVLLAETDVDHQQTRFDHDGFGRLVKVWRADGTWTAYALSSDASHPLIKLVTDSERPTSPDLITYHDRLGQEVQASVFFGPMSCISGGAPGCVQGVASTRETQYDVLGRVTATTRLHAAGATPFRTVYSYDALDRVTQVQREDASHALHPVRTTAYTLDGGSYTVTTTDASGVKTAAAFDGLGRLAQSSTFPGGTAATTHYEYGPFNLLRLVTDPAGNHQTINYDVIGRRTGLIDPDISAVHPVATAYNAFDEVASVSDAKQQITTRDYDRLGRLVSRISPDGSDSFVWDTAPGAGTGRLASRSRGAASTSFSYTAFGRVSNEHWVIDGAAYDYDYAYDNQGRLAMMRYPDVPGRARFAVGYIYNVWDQLYQVTDVTAPTAPHTVWTADTIDVEGRLTHETAGNNRATTRSYQPDTGWLQRITTSGVFDESYGYAANGNLLARTNSRADGQPGAVARTESFTYDQANRLASATVAGRTPATFTYTYDILGNLTSASDQPMCTNYVYGGAGFGPHQLASATCFGTQYAHAYDANGNETSTVAPDFREQTWTSFDKVDEIRSRFGRMKYTYDADHRRVKKEKIPGALSWMSTPQTPAPNDGDSGVWSTTIYAGQGYEKRTSSAPTIDHVFYVRAGQRTIAQLMWRQSKTAATGTDDWRYVHADRQGTVNATTDAGGAIKELQSMDAWGMRRNIDWAAGGQVVPPDTRVSYTEHQHDDEFGVIDMGGRSYDPYFKRFTSADPFIQAPHHGPSFNRYAYAWGNPTRHTDPSGFFIMEPLADTDEGVDGTIGGGGGGGGGGGEGGVIVPPSAPDPGGGPDIPGPPDTISGADPAPDPGGSHRSQAGDGPSTGQQNTTGAGDETRTETPPPSGPDPNVGGIDGYAGDGGQWGASGGPHGGGGGGGGGHGTGGPPRFHFSTPGWQLPGAPAPPVDGRGRSFRCLTNCHAEGDFHGAQPQNPRNFWGGMKILGVGAIGSAAVLVGVAAAGETIVLIGGLDLAGGSAAGSGLALAGASGGSAAVAGLTTSAIQVAVAKAMAATAATALVSHILQMGSKGTPGNNQDQNEQFRAAVREVERKIGRRLGKDELRRAHDEVTGQGYGYDELVQAIEELFRGFGEGEE